MVLRLLHLILPPPTEVLSSVDRRAQTLADLPASQPRPRANLCLVKIGGDNQGAVDMDVDTKTDLLARIAAKRHEQNRLPIHWTVQREAIDVELDDLIARVREVD